MLNAPQPFIDAFKRSYGVSSDTRVTIEWNMNRFGVVKEIKNNTAPANHEEDLSFPVESLVAPHRPHRRGIVKGFADPGIGQESATVADISGLPASVRTYTSSPDSPYKYWVSPVESSLSPSSPGHYNLTSTSPQVVWEEAISGNRLTALFESSYVEPSGVEFYISTNGTSWSKVGGSYTPDGNGLVEIYLQDNGSWSGVKNLNNLTAIKGMRVVVRGMNKPKVRCHMIEMSLRRQIEAASRTVSYSGSSSASDYSFVAPLGSAGTDTGTIVLSNHDGALDNDREGTPFHKMMNSPARVVVDCDVKAGAETHRLRQLTMFVSEWGEQSINDTRTLTLSDQSLFLKEQFPPSVLMTDVTGVEIVWRLLDSVGFTSFIVDPDPDGDAKVAFYWTDSEKSVWEHIQEITEAMQMAVYFDKNGYLRIRSRTRIFKENPKIDWVLDGSKVSGQEAVEQGRPGDEGKLPDIIDIGKPSNLEANKVTVSYTPTSVVMENRHNPAMEQVWVPEDTVTLRSAALAHSMSETQGYGMFGGSDFSYWPYEGYIQLDGEILKWTKKRYRFYSPNNYVLTRYISSDEEKEAIDKYNPRLSYRNKFDGGLYFGKNRGMMSTLPRPHPVGHQFNTIRTRHKAGSILNKPWYTRSEPENSIFKFATTDKFSSLSFTTAGKGNSGDGAPKIMGTSIRFPKNSNYKAGSAGVWFGGEYADTGYYVELSLTSQVGTRKFSNELAVYVRHPGGGIQRIGKGLAVAVDKGKWYDLDISIDKRSGGEIRLSINLNGKVAMNTVIPTSKMLYPYLSGRYGIFARGFTEAEFEYLWAANSIEIDLSQDTSRTDLITGGYRSDYYNKVLFKSIYNTRLKQWSNGRRSANAGFVFDDFGPRAHEIREWEVKFDPKPVLHSRLYLSNEWLSESVEYVSDHQSARFIVIGKGRANVILNGEDTLLYGESNPIEQKMLVYGRTVNREDQETYEVKNDASINARGTVELAIDSEWIQSKSAAKSIGDWIVKHWANGTEEVTIETFGNPMLEVGDVVGVSLPIKAMTPAKNKYYVVAVENSFQEGLSTTLTLQRVAGYKD